MTATVTLHELGDARRILDEWLLEAEGEETPEIGELWAKLDGQIEEKIERWALWILDRAADAKKLKDEEKRLADKRAALEHAVERSKAELLRCMESIGKPKINGLLATVAIQASPPAVKTALEGSVLWALEDCRPFVRREEVVRYTLDRAAVLAVHKLGDPLPPAIQVERGSHVRIR